MVADKVLIKDYLEKKMSYNDLSKKYGVSYHYLFKMFRRHNVQTRYNGRGIKEPSRIFCVNEKRHCVIHDLGICDSCQLDKQFPTVNCSSIDTSSRVKLTLHARRA